MIRSVGVFLFRRPTFSCADVGSGSGAGDSGAAGAAGADSADGAAVNSSQ